jgi:hypothetical protein
MLHAPQQQENTAARSRSVPMGACIPLLIWTTNLPNRRRETATETAINDQ